MEVGTTQKARNSKVGKTTFFLPVRLAKTLKSSGNWVVFGEVLGKIKMDFELFVK